MNLLYAETSSLKEIADKPKKLHLYTFGKIQHLYSDFVIFLKCSIPQKNSCVE